MDNELRVSITADASGLSAGLATAVDQVETAATSMASAQDKAAVAAKNLADAQRQLGAAAAGGNAAAAAIIAEYAAASSAAVAATEELTAAVAEQAPVMAADAVATAAVSSATGHVTSNFYAAQGAASLLEGRIPIRAMERFLASSSLVSGALQAAFPIIGAVAMGAVLVDLVKHAYDLYEKFIDIDAVSQKLVEDFRKMQDTDFINVHDLETATERLDQANTAAVNLNETAKQLHNESFKGLFEDILGGNKFAVGTDIAGLLQAHSAAEAGAKSQKQSIELGIKQLGLQHELTLQKIDTAHAGDAALSPEAKITAELQKQLAINRENELYERNRERAMGNPSPGTADAQMTGLKDQAARAEAAAQLKNLDYKSAEGLYFAELVEDTKKSINETKKATAAIQESWTSAFDEEIRASGTAFKETEEAERRTAEEFKKAEEEKAAGVRETAREQLAAVDDAAAGNQQQLAQQLELGRVSHQTATQMLIDAEKLKESTQISGLKAQQDLIDPYASQKALNEWKRLEDQMTDATRKGALERERIEQQEQQRFILQWKKVTNEFNSDFTNALNQWAHHSETASKAFSQMFGTIETQLMDFVAKFLLEKAEMWAMDEALQLTGLAKQRTTQGASNVAQVTSDAAVAAAGTMAYYSAFDPPMAPALAAAAFAETMVYAGTASFAVGGVVPGYNGMPMPATVHAGERVLTAGQNSTFESMVNNGGSRSSSARLNYAPTINGGASDEQLQAHSQHMMGMVKQMMRPEAMR